MACRAGKTSIFVLAFAFLWCCSLRAEDEARAFAYRVISILDGDTFIATDGNVTFRVRIAAMDAPEQGQQYAKIATARLKQLLAPGNIIINPVGSGHDRYGRVLGTVFVGKEDVALIMIQEGLATYYRPSCRDYPADRNTYNYDPAAYVAAEQESQKRGRQMWSGPHRELPCAYRQRR